MANAECPLRAPGIQNARIVNESGVRLGLAEADHFVALFPKAAFLEQFDALVALQDIPFRAQGAGSAQAAML